MRKTIGLLGLLVCGAAEARTAGYPLTLDFWTQNQVVREATLYQCRRRGPGDELVFMYCGVASQAALIVAQRTTTTQPRYYQPTTTSLQSLANIFPWLHH